MQVSVEQVGALEHRMTIRVPTARIEDRVRDRLRELAHSVRIKGFRPGKVPNKVIEQRYGQQVRSEALNEVVTDSFEQAVGENQLRPLMRPTIRNEASPTAEELVFSATFEVAPEIGTIDVSGLAVRRLVSSVDDADIDRMIETLRLQRKRWVEVGRPAELGDMVVFEFSAGADGARFPADGVERAGTIIGSGALPPAFETALIGLSVDGERQFQAEFPPGFRDTALAGKQAEVSLRVIRVQVGELPAVDEQFAAAFGVTDGGVETFRKEVGANLEREMRSALNARNKLHVIEQLVQSFSAFELPKGMIEAEAQALLRQAEERQAQSQAAAAAPLSLDGFRPAATNRVRASLLIAEIAGQAKLRVDPARVGELLATIASTYEEPGKVIDMYQRDPQLMSGLRNRVLEDQVIDWVFGAAQVIDERMSFQQLMQPPA
ncbi:MAG: trigger factor [Lysobacterales bacterium]